MENLLKLATELSLSSSVNDKESIHELFSADSLFVIESELLIEDLFATKVRTNITVIEVSDDAAIPLEIFVGSVCIIVVLIASIVYYNKRLKRHALQREEETMYVSNAMVIGICIGQYDGHLQELFGIDADIRHVVRLYRDVLGYEIYPRYDDEIKQHWTRDEIVSLLHDKAKELGASLDRYDGLVVVISSHGMNNCVISSDYKTLNK
eukprot:752709_1